MGELHVVFAVLKAIGKFIDNSGLDQAFIEAGIYGPSTMEQIKRRKTYETFYKRLLHFILGIVPNVIREIFSV